MNHRHFSAHLRPAVLVGLFFLTGCGTVYLHDEEIQSKTTQAKEEFEKVSLAEQFAEQEAFLKDLDARTTEIEVEAKLAERDLVLAQLMSGDKPVDEVLGSFLDLRGYRKPDQDPQTQTNQDPQTQTNQDPQTQTNQDPQTQTNRNSIGEQERILLKTMVDLTDRLAEIQDLGGKFLLDKTCVPLEVQNAFDLSGITDERPRGLATERVEKFEDANGECVKAKGELKKGKESIYKKFIGKLTIGRDDYTKTGLELEDLQERLAQIAAAEKDAKAILIGLNKRLSCLQKLSSGPSVSDSLIETIRDIRLFLRVLGGDKEAVVDPPASKGKKSSDTVQKCKGVTEPKERAALAMLFDTSADATELAKVVAPGLEAARADFLESRLLVVLGALAAEPESDTLAGQETQGGDVDASEDLASAREWVKSIKDLVDAVAKTQGDQDRPSLDALLVEITYQRFLRASAQAEVNNLKRRVLLLQTKRDAILSRAVSLANVQRLRDKLKGQPCGERHAQNIGLSGVIENCTGDQGARTAAEILLHVANTFNRGDVQAHAVEFKLNNLAREGSLALDRAAFDARVAMLKPAISTLARYGEGGIKPDQIAELLSLLGLTAIAVGVN